MFGRGSTRPWNRNRPIDTGIVDDEAEILIDQPDAKITIGKVDNSNWLRSSVLRGVALLVLLVAIITFHEAEWRFITSTFRNLWNWIEDWTPKHPREAIATGAFLALTLAVSSLASAFNRRNSGDMRRRTWVAFSIFLLGIWWVFWYWPVPTLRHVLGPTVGPMPFWLILVTDLIFVGLAGALFWIREWWEDLSIRRGRVERGQGGHSFILPGVGIALAAVAGYFVFQHFFS